MSDISQEYSDDEDIASSDDNTDDSDSHAALSREEHDDRAEEVPIDIDGYTGDGRSVSSSFDTGESEEESWLVSSPVDLDPELQAIKGLPAETLFRSIQP